MKSTSWQVSGKIDSGAMAFKKFQPNPEQRKLLRRAGIRARQYILSRWNLRRGLITSQVADKAEDRMANAYARLKGKVPQPIIDQHVRFFAG